LFKVESYKKGIIVSTVFNIFNKAVVFLNGILIAYFFGLQTGTDLVFYINNSILILGAFVSALNITVVIPESMRIRTFEGPDRAMGFLNFYIFFYTLVITLVLGLAVIFDPVSFFSVVSNFKRADLINNRSLLYLSLPLFGMIFITNLLVDILTSHKFFTIPMLIGIVNGVFSIVCMSLFHGVFGLKSFLFGLLLSYTLNILTLVYIMKRFLQWKFTRVFIVKDNRIWKNLGFAQLGNFTSTAASYMPMYILSGFNTGIITAVTFAQQISTLPSSLITYQFSSVAGIKFNELYAANDTKSLNRVFYECASFLHFVMIPIACLLFFFSRDVIEIVLGFTSLSEKVTDNAALFLKYLGLLMPFMVVNTLMARLFNASHKIKESFAYQVGFNIVLIICLYVAVQNFGITGYPLAMVLTYLLNFGFCYFLEKKFFNFVDFGAIFKEFWLLVVVNLIILFVVAYFFKFVPISNSFLKVTTGTSLYLLLLICVNKVFRLNHLVTSHLEITLKKIFNYGASRSG
jgi:putative peptidoglycan lipid II flippase